jgi:serine/threonine protein kinase
MICPNCKTENDASNAVCVKCGSLLEEAGGMDFSKTGIGDASADSVSGLKTTIGLKDLRKDFPKGTLFANRYEILDEGMFGGMGVVYKVMDKELHEVVALKVVLPEFVNNTTAIERFKQEVKIARSLNHPNLVRVYDLGESDGMKYFTMEYIEGSSLRGLLDVRKKNNKPFGLEAAFDIISQLCNALHYAHQFTIHRDIKPENMLMPRDEKGSGFKVKVTDFGLAKMITPSMLSLTTHRMGTPYYMAPEQLTDASNVDKRADLYSVGIIIYELLTLSLPIGRYEPLSKRRPDIPPAIDSVVDKALETQPEKRFSDAAELNNALKSVIQAPVKKPAPTETKPAGEPPVKVPVIPQIPKLAEVKQEEKKLVIEPVQPVKSPSKSSYKIPVIAGAILIVGALGYFGYSLLSKKPQTVQDKPILIDEPRPQVNKGQETAGRGNVGKNHAPSNDKGASSINKQVEMYLSNARGFLNKKEFSLALVEVDKALAIDSGNSDAHKVRGDIERYKNEQQNEIAEYLNDGKDYFNQGKYQLSIEKMKEVLKRNRENAEARQYMAMAQEKLKEIENQFINPEVGRPRY